MPAKKRISEVSVMQALMDEPYRFQFVQAVRILMRWMTQNGVPHDHAFAHVLRFKNSLSLNFSASEMEALQAGPAVCLSDTDLLRALREDAAMRITLTPAFLGLLGINGTLPLHKTQRIASAERWDGGAGARAFIDLFSHRMVGMFFQAWGKYRLEHKLDIEGRDGQLPLLQALAGTRRVSECAQTLRDQVEAYYAALLRHRPVSANTISRVLTHYFGVPIALESLVEGWQEIPEQERSTLGSPVARLGFGAALGVRVRRRDIRTRLNIGPLDPADVERLLPRSAAALALARVMSLFGLPALEFEVRLMLKPSCIAPLTLTNTPGQAKRLGWDAFLPGRDGKVSRNTVDYRLRLPDVDMSPAGLGAHGDFANHVSEA